MATAVSRSVGLTLCLDRVEAVIASHITAALAASRTAAGSPATWAATLPDPSDYRRTPVQASSWPGVVVLVQQTAVTETPYLGRCRIRAERMIRVTLVLPAAALLVAYSETAHQQVAEVYLSTVAGVLERYMQESDPPATTSGDNAAAVYSCAVESLALEPALEAELNSNLYLMIGTANLRVLQSLTYL